MKKESCVTINGTPCPSPSGWTGCEQLWSIQSDNLFCLQDEQNKEAVNIAGATINFHKLLGIHEQSLLIDQCKHGSAISGGDLPGYPASNAFNAFNMEWRSAQVTASDIIKGAYIGYDFGEVKLPNGRQRYGVDAPVRKFVTAIRIKQTSKTKATKVRLERSDDGVKWLGVGILEIPDTTELYTAQVSNKRAQSRYWRIRPVEITAIGCDRWAVAALQMFDYEATEHNNIQDLILLENRDRDYDTDPQTIKGYYDLQDVGTDLSRFGLTIGYTEYRIKVNFTDFVSKVGRPPIIGDMAELPSEAQYDVHMNKVLRYLEITDVTWDSGSYTPGWQPLMLLLTAKPALASQETRDIFGDLSDADKMAGVDDKLKKFQDYRHITDIIASTAADEVPERGNDASNTIRLFSDEEKAAASEAGVNNIQSIGLTPKSLYVEDAMPSNGAPFTSGSEFPTAPANGDYHRMIYTGLSKDVPAKLYRWSAAKGRWIYLETDRRAQFNNQKSFLAEFTSSPNKVSNREI